MSWEQRQSPQRLICGLQECVCDRRVFDLTYCSVSHLTPEDKQSWLNLPNKCPQGLFYLPLSQILNCCWCLILHMKSEFIKHAVNLCVMEIYRRRRSVNNSLRPLCNELSVSVHAWPSNWLLFSGSWAFKSFHKLNLLKYKSIDITGSSHSQFMLMWNTFTS